MSKQALKERKRKRRERDNRQKKLRDKERRLQNARRHRYQATYPGFRFNAGAADPDFARAVKKAVATISFEDRSAFPAWEAELYRLLKQEGARALRDALLSIKLECNEQGSPDGQLAETHFLLNLGQVVLNRIPAATRERHLPMSDMLLVPGSSSIRVICRSLCRAKGPGGTVYYSSRRPTLEIDGEPKVVAFSKHAIDQTSERIKPHSKISYSALGDIFAFFDQCTYFELCELHRNQLGFCFYDECAEGYVTQWYVEHVLGTENLDVKAGQPHYRVGYCPAVVEGDFVKAKTLLLPGYTTTPEYNAIWQHASTRTEREELIAQAKTWRPRTLYETQDFSLLKWFHDHGVPQVVHLNGKVYDHTWH
jgi:hypothetical protein